MSGRKKRQPRGACANKGEPLVDERHGRKRQPLVIESDLPRLNAVTDWERELLLPFVSQLVDALTDCDRQTEE